MYEFRNQPHGSLGSAAVRIVIRHGPRFGSKWVSAGSCGRPRHAGQWNARAISALLAAVFFFSFFFFPILFSRRLAASPSILSFVKGAICNYCVTAYVSPGCHYAGARAGGIGISGRSACHASCSSWFSPIRKIRDLA
jgi:hypothetical protein